jgi:phosphatidate cytidylyltransferase
MSNLKLRVISGVILAAVAIGATLAGGLWFRLFAAIISAASAYEWMSITGMKGGTLPGTFAIAGVAAAILLVLLDTDPLYPLFAVAFAAGAASYSYAPTPALPRHLVAASVIHCGFPLLALAYLRGDNQPGLWAILFLFAVVWMTDIFAYFVGRAVGGPKLAPTISPGKTWSGAIGGTAFGVGAGLAVAHLAAGRASIAVAVLALALSVAGQLGDLYESALKRRYGVKDSSQIIPGHGGVLDRVDALVVAAAVLYALAVAASQDWRPAPWLFGG